MSVVVAGGGARTAVGLDRRQTGFLLRAGFPAIAEAPLANGAGEPITMAYLPNIDEALVGEERLAKLAAGPLAEAMEAVRAASVDVLIAIDRALPSRDLAIHTLERLVQRVVPQPNEVRIQAVGETLGGLLEDAVSRLEARSTDVVVLGGVHSDYDPRVIGALDASGRLFARDNLDARIPGEAAAFVLLMRPSGPARFGLRALAQLVGFGRAPDAVRPDNDEQAYRARGLTRAVREATQPLRDRGERAGWLLNDLTGEMWRLYEWQALFTRARKVLGEPFHLESPAQRIGYLGAAALPLFFVVGATAWEHGYAPASTLLATSATDHGERAAIVLQRA